MWQLESKVKSLAEMDLQAGLFIPGRGQVKTIPAIGTEPIPKSIILTVFDSHHPILRLTICGRNIA
jgi:hypothetical protein